ENQSDTTSSSNKQETQQVERSAPQSPNEENRLKTIIDNATLIREEKQQYPSAISSGQQSNTSEQADSEKVSDSPKEIPLISDDSRKSLTEPATLSSPIVENEIAINKQEDKKPLGDETIKSQDTSSMDKKESDNKSEADLRTTSASFDTKRQSDEQLNTSNINEEKNFSSSADFGHQVTSIIDHSERLSASDHFPHELTQSESNEDQSGSSGYQREEKHDIEEASPKHSSALEDSMEDVSKSSLDAAQTAPYIGELHHSTSSENNSQQQEIDKLSDIVSNKNQQTVEKELSQPLVEHQLSEHLEEESKVADEEELNLTLEAIQRMFQDLANDENVIVIDDELPEKVLSALGVKDDLLQTLFEGVFRKYIVQAASDGAREDTLKWNEFRDILFPILTGHYSDRHVRKLFELFDTSNDGYLSKEEIEELLQLIQVDDANSTADNIIQEFDTDNDGRLSADELILAIKEINDTKDKYLSDDIQNELWWNAFHDDDEEENQTEEISVNVPVPHSNDQQQELSSSDDLSEKNKSLK
ncbi:unnamed protein product, partial [Didymodactylos carnosus]